MAKKITKEDWFAAASAHYLWGDSFNDKNHPVPQGCNNVIDFCGAKGEQYASLLGEAGKAFYPDIAGTDDLGDISFLAAQIGCELAGL
jgi:hypothetical protein